MGENGDATPSEGIDYGKPVLLVSGGKTTVQVAIRLAGDFMVGVYAEEALPQFQPHIDKVLCPVRGAQEMLRVRAANDAALLAARAVAALPYAAPRFSMNGSTPDALGPGLASWLPGVVISHANRLALELRCLEQFMKVARVAAWVTHEDVTPRFKAATLYLKSQGVPTIHVPHANHFIKARPDVHDECLCDWILAASPHMRDWYVERGYPADRVAVVGHPPWDPWAGDWGELTREHARLVLHPEGGDGPVVHASIPWAQYTNLVDDHGLAEKTADAMLEAAREGGWKLVWGQHPGNPQSMVKWAAEKARDAGVPAVIERGHLPYALRAADVALAMGPSNVLVEAALADAPPVTVPMPGYGFDGEPPAEAAPDAGELRRAVEEAAGRAGWEEARPGMVERYAHLNDGKATERAANAVREIVDGCR